MTRRHSCSIWYSAFCFLFPVVIAFLGVIFLTSPCVGEVEISRLAVFPFVNADIPSDDPESIVGLGTMLASRLTTLFAQKCEEIRVVSQTVLKEVIRQQGMSDMGLLDASRIPEIGAIADADHFWTGTYKRSGSGISVDAILWSVEEAAAVEAVNVRLQWFFPSRPGHVEALSCKLFSRMYQEMFSLPSQIECSAPSLLGELVAAARIGAGSVRMSSLNNVIRQANVKNGIQIPELTWMPNTCVSIGYIVIPDLFTAFAEIEYLWASRNAGSTGNVSLECTAVIPRLALEWQIAVPWETEAQLFVRGAAGWASVRMEKRDVSGLLNCPARVLGNGLSYDVTVGAGFVLGNSWRLQIEGSYKGCSVPTTSVRLPTLDLSGVRAEVTFEVVFGGQN